MKRALIYQLLAVRLLAATYNVSSAGNDSNNGSAGAPWLTLGHALAAVADGDTINIVANGSAVNCDGSVTTGPSGITIQSTALASFWPPGYRTNPALDSANYGKCQVTLGLIIGAVAHGSHTPGASYGCGVSALMGDRFTCGALPNLVNGSQIEIELNGSGFSPSSSVPSPLSVLTRYYVVNCSNCSTNGQTFQVAATPGGAPITGLSCSGTCSLGALYITQPLQVTVGSATITSPDAIADWVNGTPIAFSAAGLQQYGTLPEPLALDTFYYVVNLSGRTFQVAARPGGTPIVMTTVGTGPLEAANTNVPHDWKIRGIEMVSAPGTVTYGIRIGTAQETSVYGMPSNFEIDRCYIHGLAGSAPPVRAVTDNGRGVYIHDSYLTGFFQGEAQAIQGTTSPGPTAIVNNFTNASGENSIYGGGYGLSGIANANKLFQGNYFYKSPSRRVDSGTGAPSGPCWYDTTDSLDPDNAGGQWYHDTAGAQWYRCGSGYTWAATGSAPANLGNPLFKDLTEHKNGRYFSYIGNLYNYSWAQAQSGEAWNNSSEPGSGPGMANDHILMMNNAVFNVYQANVRVNSCNQTVTLPCIYDAGSHTFYNNLVVVSPLACGVAPIVSTCGYQPFQSGWGQPIPPAQTAFQFDVIWHNTIFGPDSGFLRTPPVVHYGHIQTGCPSNPSIEQGLYADSILLGDFGGDCFSRGSEIANFFGHSTFSHIALKGGSSGGYGSVGTNTFTNAAFPADNTAIKYVNADGTIHGDYHLNPASPHSAANSSPTLLSSDGTDLGADIDLINMATSGAAAGTPPWDQQAGLRVDTGSSQAVFSYTAPTADACTATIYRAPARIPANQVATATDNSANSISDGLARQLYISGLQPLTQYWYRVACGGGILLVGNLWTVATGQGSLAFSFDWSSPTPMRYSSSPSLSNPVSLPAATRQFIPVASNSVMYVQAGTAGTITMLIAP